MSEERDQRVVELAVQAAGTADGKWGDRVVSLVPRVAAMFREPRDEADPNSLLNVARKVAEANVFTAEYRDHEYDGEGRDGNRPTQRIFVRVYDEKGQDGDYLDDDGCQTVRTEPMWSATGRHTRKTLESMQSGQRAVFYRYTESISKTQKMGLLVHVEPLGQRSRQESAPRVPPPAAPPPAREAGEGPAPSPATDEQAQLAHEIEGLSNKQKVWFMRACRADDVTNPWEANAREMPIVRRHLEEARTM